MKKIYLFIVLVSFISIKAQYKDIIINSNDSSVVSTRIVEFIPKVLPAIDGKDTAIVESSDPSIVEIKHKYMKSGETDTAIVKKFGTVYISIVPKKPNSKLKTGFKIMVRDITKTNTNKLAHGTIASEDGKNQYVENGQNLEQNLNSLIIKLYAQNLIKESESVRVYWDVIPDKVRLQENPSLTNSDIIQFYNNEEDSTMALLKYSGNHTIILVATDGTRIDTISSFNYTRLGFDYPLSEYIVAKNMVTNYTSDKSAMIIKYTDKNYVKDGAVYQNLENQKYLIFDKSLTDSIYVIDKDTLTWAEDRTFIDERLAGPSSLAYTYNYRRFDCGLFFMTQDLAYSPPPSSGETVDFDGNTTDGNYFNSDGYYRSFSGTGNTISNMTQFRKVGVYYHESVIGASTVSSLRSSVPKTEHMVLEGPCPEGWRVPSIWDISQLFEKYVALPDNLININLLTLFAIPSGVLKSFYRTSESTASGTGTNKAGFSFCLSPWSYKKNYTYMVETMYALANPRMTGHTNCVLDIWNESSASFSFRLNGWSDSDEKFIRVRCVKDPN
jgi:uncharacterized protein (TIGR02145 family)